MTPSRLIKRMIIQLGTTPIIRDVMPDKMYLGVLYSYVLKKKINWDNPKRYNEKLQCLKLYDHNDVYHLMADKYRVKEYISEKIGSEYVIPLLGVWDKPKDIDFDKLPNSFVLKCNHDGGVIIVKDKSTLDIPSVIKKLNIRIRRDYFYKGREWVYKGIKPCVIAEEYFEDATGELSDYKVMCFDGAARIIEVHKGRFKDHTQDFYDADWNKLSVYQGDIKPSDVSVPKPEFFYEMIRLSEKLSTGIPHVRVDWYDYNGKLFFGEFTFYDSAGFDDFIPDEWNEKIGSWINLKSI